MPVRMHARSLLNVVGSPLTVLTIHAYCTQAVMKLTILVPHASVGKPSVVQEMVTSVI